MAVRIDQKLVELGLAKSRAQAQALIEHGCVSILRPKAESAKVTKASQRVGADDSISLSQQAVDLPVSRAAYKMDALIEAANVSIAGSLCIDAGQSTGGFTERLLQHGAGYVLGVEVGHGQLASRLLTNEKVGCLERTNIKSCTRDKLAAYLATQGLPRLSQKMSANGADIISADLSFISLRKVLPDLTKLLAHDGHLLALVKPQFELGRGAVNKRGVITKLELLASLPETFTLALEPLGLHIQHWLSSPIAGSDGNTEFLLHAQRIENPHHPNPAH